MNKLLERTEAECSDSEYEEGNSNFENTAGRDTALRVATTCFVPSLDSQRQNITVYELQCTCVCPDGKQFLWIITNCCSNSTNFDTLFYLFVDTNVEGDLTKTQFGCQPSPNKL